MFFQVDVNEKCFLGVTAMGGIAGLFEGAWTTGIDIHNILPGVIAVISAVFIGGFAGFFAKDGLRLLRGLRLYTGQSNEGMFLGAFAGAFLGTLFQFLLSEQAHTILGASCGAFIGAFIGAFPDEIVPSILELMKEDKNTFTGNI